MKTGFDRYISKRDQLTKNNREDDDEVSNNGVMYEIPGSSKCPVKSLSCGIRIEAQQRSLWLFYGRNQKQRSQKMVTTGTAMFQLAKTLWEIR